MSDAVEAKGPAQRGEQAASGPEARRAASALSQDARGNIHEVRAVLKALMEDQPAHATAKLRARLDDLLKDRMKDRLDDILDAHMEERAANFRTSAHEGGYDMVEVYRYDVARHSPMSGGWPRDRASSK